jgi:kinetochore protein Nuf2
MADQEDLIPPMKYKEILDCLTSLQLPVTLDELKAPTPELVQNIYEHFVDFLCPMPRLALSEFDFDHPELYDEASQEFQFERRLFTLMRTCGVSNFGLKDLIAPTAQGLKRSLRGLINFTKYREQRLNTFMEQAAKSDALVERKMALEEQHGMLLKAVNQFEAQRARDAPMVEQMQTEVNDLEKQIAELNKAQAVLQTDIRTLKTRNTDLSDKIASHKFSIQETVSECDRLQSGIVSSPDRVRREIRDMAANAENERGTLQMAEKKARELDARIVAVEHAQSQVEKAIQMLQEAGEDHGKYKAVVADVRSCEAKCEQLQREMEDLAGVEAHLKRQLVGVQDRLVRVQGTFSAKQEAVRASLEAARQERVMLERERLAQQKAVAEKEEMSTQLVARIEDTRRKHDDDMSRLKTKYEELEGCVKRYHEILLASMDQNAFVA